MCVATGAGTGSSAGTVSASNSANLPSVDDAEHCYTARRARCG